MENPINAGVLPCYKLHPISPAQEHTGESPKLAITHIKAQEQEQHRLKKDFVQKRRGDAMR